MKQKYHDSRHFEVLKSHAFHKTKRRLHFLVRNRDIVIVSKASKPVKKIRIPDNMSRLREIVTVYLIKIPVIFLGVR